MIILSGGDLGGNEVSPDNWVDGEIKDINGYLYRRSGLVGIFCGMNNT